MNEKPRSSFKGSIGFVLAAAGSAVGLGNIWRFPYLAARNGGGLFLAIYLMLALTFGFAMLTTEISIGRKTKQSPLTAYTTLKKGWGWLGWLASIVPFMIMPYYCVIGGWVLKYFIAFMTNHGAEAAQDDYFTGFITSQYEPIITTFVFLAICALIIYVGVEGGIERFSKIVMPILFILVIGIAIYSLTLKNADTGATGLKGLKILFIPSVKGLTFTKFCMTIMDAIGQLFYSLSVSMGIMITYGSYVKDEDNLARSINQIEIFDTAVAFLAGVMIIPAVYVFMGPDGMSTGPSLMFVSLPKIFMAMGPIGNIIGSLFFAMVLFAAITSAISILEAIVSGMMDKFKLSRHKSTIGESLVALVIAVIVCLGYNKLFFNIKLPNGNDAQILDIMDYISNNVFMPVVAIATCILVGWIISPKIVTDEVTKNGEKFNRKILYGIMVRFIAPVLLILLLLISLGVFKKFIK
ncbi:MAG: sodium-dependent transporter [Eubacterium sp.]|nr:sodium-dependent transporter [Eubacterium sp.]